MAHELEINADGTANMVWTNQKPWHGLGTEMDPKAGAIAWMKAAGLDWKIVKQPMEVTLPNGEKLIVEGKREGELGVLIRDRGDGTFARSDVFGPAGPEWVPVQNEQVFEFMDRFCKKGKMTMETCGALTNGTEIWALAKYASEFDLIKGDQAKGYLLFHSPHIWGKSTSVRNCITRVVCNNTLTMAFGEKNASIVRMPHIMEFDTEAQERVEETLGLAENQTKVFQEQVAFLSKKKAKAEQVQEFICRIYQPKTLRERELDNDNSPLMDSFNPSAEKVWDAIQFAPGHDLNGSKGTWWGAFNGVTYQEDHLRVSHSDDSNLLHSGWFGSGARRKSQALDLAMEYANAA